MARMKGKPKIVPVREPAGRLSRAVEHEIGAASPAAAKRLRDMALAGAALSEWGTELGRLFLGGKLDADLYEAGKRWARLTAAYHAATGGPAEVVSIGLWTDGHRQPPDPDSEAGQRIAEREKAVCDAWREADAVLSSSGCRASVDAVCIRNLACSGVRDREFLKTGLLWLVDFWGIR